MTSYTLKALPAIMTHGGPLPTWLGDYDDGDFTQTDALAASGDYFMVLITRLDLLSQSLPQDSSEQIELEHLINTLFYLQRHYAIIPKAKLKQ